MHPFIRRARRPEPMTSGSIPGHLIRYAIPAVLGNLFQVTGAGRGAGWLVMMVWEIGLIVHWRKNGKLLTA